MTVNNLGRPTAYKPEYCQEIIKFFDIIPNYEKQVVKLFKGMPIEVLEDTANALPTLAGFAQKIGVHRDTLNEWTRIYPDFSDAIKKCKECQEAILIENGLKSLYNPAFAIFTAKNLINWKDKQEISADKDSPPVLLVKMYKEENDD